MPYEIPAPMLAKSVPQVPAQDAVAGGLSFEPKWDGFRALISWDGTDVEIGSRGAKPLTRYFPELVEAFARLLPEPCLLDGEVVVPKGAGGRAAAGLGVALAAHPSRGIPSEQARRRDAGDVHRVRPARARRARPAGASRSRCAARSSSISCGGVPHPLHVTRTTEDADLAQRWLAEFEGAGLDGVIAKPLAQPYAPNKRTMFKIKHARTADVVALGYRVHKSGQGVGSLLVGLYGEDGTLYPVGGVAAWSNARRLELVDELEPLVLRGDDGEALTGEGEKSRFAAARKDSSFVKLRPERVLEVRYDQLEGWRFRHTVQFERWRPDRDPRSCTYEQLETVSAYDLGDVLD